VDADLVLGIDCSTTASKAVAWNARGESAAEGRAPLTLQCPHPGWGEQDARQWWDATVVAIREVVAQVAPERIEAVCVTHQRETFVPVGGDGTPLRHAIVWLDERSRAQLAALDRQFGHDALHRVTGRPPSLTQSLPKLVWLTEHEPAAIRDAAFIVDVHAYLVHALSGEWVTSLACADPMGIVDMARGVWATDLIRDVGLRPDQFVALASPGTVIAAVSPAGAAATGLVAGHRSSPEPGTGRRPASAPASPGAARRT
jgi:sugar (pentulose or hexulose) kinase